MLLNHYRTRSR